MTSWGWRPASRSLVSRTNRLSLICTIITGALALWQIYTSIHRISATDRTAPFWDIQVYRGGMRTWLSGHSVYDASFTPLHLLYTYPPFALLFLAPFLLGTIHQLATTLSILDLLIIILISISLVSTNDRFCSARTPWRPPIVLLAIAATCHLEPVEATLAHGQVNLLLLFLVALDAFTISPKYRGFFTGLATAVKLTPAVFLLYWVLSRQRQAAVNQLATTIICTLLGFAIAPASSLTFWTTLDASSKRVGPVWYTSNQSINGVATRLLSLGHPATGLWVVASIAVGLLSVLSIRRTWNQNLTVLSFGITGLLGLLVSPVSWTHHWVWAIPALIGSWKPKSPTAIRVAATALTVVLVVAPEWHMPHAGNRELHWTWWQHIVGNLDVWISLILILCAAICCRPKPILQNEG